MLRFDVLFCIEVVGSSDLQSSKLCDNKFFSTSLLSRRKLICKYHIKNISPKRRSTMLDHYLPLVLTFKFVFCTMMWVCPCSLCHFLLSKSLVVVCYMNGGAAVHNHSVSVIMMFLESKCWYLENSWFINGFQLIDWVLAPNDLWSEIWIALFSTSSLSTTMLLC